MKTLRLYTHVVLQKKEKDGINYQHSPSVIGKATNRGITLVALVVTIVVLLILAGITIMYTMGENSIFKQASDAKIKTEIAKIREKIEIIQIDWWTEKKIDPTVTVDDFFDKLIEADIITGKDDVTGPEKDGENDVYIVDTTDGYIVEIIVTPDGNIIIGEIIKGEKLPPKISTITVTNKTSNSIEVEVTVARIEDGKLSYYYKKESETEYHELAGKQNTTDLTATFEGLDQNQIYNIKVVVKNKKGNGEQVINVLTGELQTGVISQKGETIWSNNKASIELETTNTNLTLKYQIGSIDDNGWLPYNGQIGNLNHNDTVYVVLTDGSNYGEIATIVVRDGGAPIVTVSRGNVTTNSITVSASAVDAEWGMGTSPSYSFFIKKTSESTYSEAKYTGTNTSYTFTGLIQNTNYDVKVTTKDKAENEGAGTVTGIKTGTVGGAGSDLATGNIVANSPTWSGGKASITLSTNSGMQIQWQKNGISGEWTTVAKGTTSTTIPNLNHGDNIYARLWDGTNAGSEAYVTIRDSGMPTATISNLTGSANTGANITATVVHTDNESGPKATECKWVFTTSSTKIGTGASSYTGGTFSSNSQNITWSTTIGGTYFLHVLTVDNAGNKTETVSSSSVTVSQLATGITVSPTTATIDVGATKQLTATVTPTNTNNKAVTWTSSNTSVATVNSNGLVTGVKAGTATITVKTTDGSNKSASCSVKVETAPIEIGSDEASWSKMNEIAKAIANDSSITSDSTEATGTTASGDKYKVSVGGIYRVKYNGAERRVRVLGFKHDDLVNTGAYGGRHTKASISFEFLDFMTGDSYMPMNASNTNSGGWASTKMRTDLNGSGSTIGGLGVNLNNKAYIKQVKKKYIPTYNVASTSTCNDFLWLLAASEVINNGYNGSGTYGFAITSEGNQYQYYKGISAGWNVASTGRTKYNGAGNANNWWLRSPYNYHVAAFCHMASSGHTNEYEAASSSLGVAPGFCI